ncbi:TPA: hypothetical protein QDZ84_003501 [Shewanella algae]|uniref:hypothetical protein n=1 Tax=Shewanella TaxID=22 RepID=UPI001430CDD5|nr:MULTISPECIES: hypothetical protein [Shewanella]NJI86968.1 hypothetical protein [Shewanella sp. Iso12]HDS1208462.1 hypothetical protein [Shewanella algae]
MDVFTETVGLSPAILRSGIAWILTTVAIIIAGIGLLGAYQRGFDDDFGTTIIEVALIVGFVTLIGYWAKP